MRSSEDQYADAQLIGKTGHIWRIAKLGRSRDYPRLHEYDSSP